MQVRMKIKRKATLTLDQEDLVLLSSVLALFDRLHMYLPDGAQLEEKYFASELRRELENGWNGR